MADDKKNVVGSPKATMFKFGKGIKDAVASVSKTVGSAIPNLHAPANQSKNESPKSGRTAKPLRTKALTQKQLLQPKWQSIKGILKWKAPSKLFFQRYVVLQKDTLFIFKSDEEAVVTKTVDLSFRDILPIKRKFGFKLKHQKTGDSVYFMASSQTEYDQWFEALKQNLETTKHHHKVDAAETISVFIGSWNMGNSDPPANLSEWIPPSMYDIYAIGVQESSEDPKQWNQRLQEAVGKGYVCIISEYLWEMRLSVFVKSDHQLKISDVKKSTKPTGIANVVGNKGAIGVSFMFQQSSLAFVSSHLAAMQTAVTNRNSMFTEICGGLGLGTPKAELTEQFDYLFWFGDLNYRIDLERPVVVDLVQKQEYDILYESDQLRKEMAAGRTFKGWKEEQPLFKPTYRYTKNTDQYNDAKGRIPAWCDRILWKLGDPVNLPLRITTFNDVDALKTSDHKPIYATFTLGVQAQAHDHHLQQEYSLIFKDLHCTNLLAADSNGKSDPFVVFTSVLFEDEDKHQTSVVAENLNPTWGKEMVECLFMGPALENVLQQHVTLTVMDYDKLSANDMIGGANISLADCREEPKKFKVELLHNGLAAGWIEGTMQLLEFYDESTPTVSKQK